MIGFHQPHHSFCSNCSTERLPQVYGTQVPGPRDHANVLNSVKPRGSVLSIGCETGSAGEQVHVADVHREGGDAGDGMTSGDFIRQNIATAISNVEHQDQMGRVMEAVVSLDGPQALVGPAPSSQEVIGHTVAAVVLNTPALGRCQGRGSDIEMT